MQFSNLTRCNVLRSWIAKWELACSLIFIFFRYAKKWTPSFWRIETGFEPVQLGFLRVQLCYPWSEINWTFSLTYILHWAKGAGDWLLGFDWSLPSMISDMFSGTLFDIMSHIFSDICLAFCLTYILQLSKACGRQGPRRRDPHLRDVKQSKFFLIKQFVTYHRWNVVHHYIFSSQTSKIRKW